MALHFWIWGECWDADTRTRQNDRHGRCRLAKLQRISDHWQALQSLCAWSCLLEMSWAPKHRLHILIHSLRIEWVEDMGSVGASCAFQCLQATMLDISWKSSDRWCDVMATYPSSFFKVKATKPTPKHLIISPFHPLSWAFTSGCCSGFQVADLQLLVRCSRHKTPVTWLQSSAEEWWQIWRSESTHQASPSCKMP